jgi:hypothetical protein
MSGADRKRSIIKIVGLGVLTIFLGAIGSGLWERFLAPMGDWGFRQIITGSGRLSGAYLDHLYSEVGSGFHEHASNHLLLGATIGIVLFNVAGILFFLAVRKLRRSGELPNLPDVLGNRALVWAAVLMATINACTYGETVFSDGIRQEAVVWVERSLEIVRPGVPDATFLELRARYRGVRDYATFIELWREINRIADANKILIPKLKPLGVP